MNTPNTINIELPFSGFYESLHSSEIDDVIEMEIDEGYIDENKYNETDIDYTKIKNAMAELYVKTYNELFLDQYKINLNLQFSEIKSPRFYNFETDKLIASIETSVFENVIKNHLDKDKFIEVLNDKYSVRSGWTPFNSTLESILLIENNDYQDSHIEDYAKFSIDIFEQLLSESVVIHESNYFENTFTVISENLPNEIYNELT